MKKHIYQLYDDNTENLGVLEIEDVSPTKFRKLIPEYKKTDEEEYNVDDFIEFLKQKGYRARAITPEEDFYF